MRDWHGREGGREACGSEGGWWFSVFVLLCVSSAALRIFENMHKDQLEETVTLEVCWPPSFPGKPGSFPE